MRDRPCRSLAWEPADSRPLPALKRAKALAELFGEQALGLVPGVLGGFGPRRLGINVAEKGVAGVLIDGDLVLDAVVVERLLDGLHLRRRNHRILTAEEADDLPLDRSSARPRRLGHAETHGGDAAAVERRRRLD